MALIADTCLVLVAMVMRMEQVTQRFGINISAKKSEVMYIGRGEGDVRIQDMVLRGQRMKQVEEFAHLGSVLTSDGKLAQYVERSRARATRAFGTLKVKMKIFNPVVLPVLLYGASTWVLTRTEEIRLDVFEMRTLRNITGVRWDHFVRI